MGKLKTHLEQYCKDNGITLNVNDFCRGLSGAIKFFCNERNKNKQTTNSKVKWFFSLSAISLLRSAHPKLWSLPEDFDVHPQMIKQLTSTVTFEPSMESDEVRKLLTICF